MKKILSFTLALCMVITSLFTGVYAMAETTKPTTAEIKAKISGAADYLVTDDSAFTVANAIDFLTLLESGKDMSAYKEDFVKSVKDNLNENQAHLLSTSTEWTQNESGEWVSTTTSIESPATYGAVILALDALGYNFTAFEGYNLADSFSKVDLKNNADNPYYYRVTLAGAEKAGLSDKFIKEVCDSFVNTYYTKGSGLNWYGFSCDNTCQFVIAMAPYYENYKEVVDDALSLIAAYKTDGGYFYNAEYGKDAGPNSTALALAAYSAMGDIEKAEAAYADLCKFEGKNTGVFTYFGEENYSATKDALFGLEMLVKALPACYDGHKYTAAIKAPTCTENGYTTYTCSVCGNSYKDNVLKATGHNFGTNAQNCSICGIANPSYKIPSVTGLAVKSKSTNAIRLTWDKIAEVKDYVIYQYNSTTNKYEKIAQVSSTQSSYRVSDLKAGTIYKFRIAALVNGVEGAKSNYIKATTVPAKGAFSSVTTPAKKQIKVKLPSAVCTGYQIQWSTKKNFSSNYKTVTFASSTKTKTIKTAQSKKTYYLRVRTFTKVNGVKVYGKWSTVKSIKVK